MRRIVFALAVAASWVVLLLWAASIDIAAPLSPAQTREFPGDDFSVVFGKGAADADHLRIDAASADDTSLETLRPSDIEAETFPTLRYRFARFPRTLELSLIFRTADDPEDVAISLPWPGEGTRTFDLSQVPQWRGRIVEIGFAEFPTAQVVPAARGFKPFEVAEAQLWSRSWQGDIAALATDWFGAWPWTQRSVHALGRETNTPRARSLVLFVAMAVGIVLAWLALLFGWRRPVFAPAAALAVALAWFALDASWLSGLWHRLLTTRAVYAQLSWAERGRTVADTDVVAAVATAKTMLQDAPPETRVLVYADPDHGYELLRFIWHALPLNTAVFAYANASGGLLPDGTVIVFLKSDAWRSNPYFRQLLAHSEHLTSSASLFGDGYEDSDVVMFRYRHER